MILKNSMRSKNIYYIFLFTVISIAFIQDLKADDLTVYIQLPGDKVEYCQNEGNIILTGKGFHGEENIVKHEWESTSEGIIEETRNQFAVINTASAGDHIITYHAWDENENYDKVSVTIHVYPLPENEIKSSKGFFTWLFGKDLPQKLEAENTKADYKYQWYLNNEKIENATESSYKANEKGRYRLVTISAEGCKSYSSALEID